MLSLWKAHATILLAAFFIYIAFPIAGIDFSSRGVFWTSVSLLTLTNLVCLVFKANRIIFPPAIKNITLILFILSFWHGLQIFWSIEQDETMKSMFKSMFCLLFTFTSYNALANIPRIQLLRMIAVIITAALFAALLGFLYQMQDIGFALYGDRASKRYLSMFQYSNVAGLAVMLLGLTNWLLFFEKDRRYKIIAIANTAVTLLLLIGINSYSSLAGFLLSLLIITAYFIKRISNKPIALYSMFIVIACAASLLVYWLINSMNVDRILTGHERFALWDLGFEYLARGYWAYGTGSGTMGIIKYSSTHELSGGLHNAYLQVFVEEGLPGILVYTWFFVITIRYALSKKSGGLAMLTFILASMLHNVAENSGSLMGQLDGLWVFVSWYLLAFFIAFTDSAPLKADSKTPATTPG